MNRLPKEYDLRKASIADENQLGLQPLVSVAYSSERSDKEVWANFINGSEEAFSHIYQCHFESLVRLGNQFSLSKEVIRDALQDFFIDLRERRSKLSAIQCIKPYLIKSFRRRLLDIKKKEEKRQTRLNHFHNMYFSVTPSVEKVIADGEAASERSTKLNEAIQKLSQNQREAIYYLYFENLSYKEIQQIMDMKYVRSVRNLVYKALDRLRDHYSW